MTFNRILILVFLEHLRLDLKVPSQFSLVLKEITFPLGLLIIREEKAREQSCKDSCCDHSF